MMNHFRLQDYLEYIKEEKGLTDSTLESYNRDLMQFSKYLEDKHIDSIANVNKATIITYMMFLQKNGKSAATIARSLASLRSYFQYLLNLGLINEDPTYNLRSPIKEKKLPDILSKKEVALLLAQPSGDNFIEVRDKAMLKLLYATGIKVTELIALNVDNLDTQLGCLLLNCNDDSDRLVPVDYDTLACLKDYRDNYRNKFVKDSREKALFVNYSGNRLTRQGFWKIIRQYSKKANIEKKITPMTLRHSFAFHRINSRHDLNKAANILEYSSFQDI